jgi:hypothetical protein
VGAGRAAATGIGVPVPVKLTDTATGPVAGSVRLQVLGEVLTRPSDEQAPPQSMNSVPETDVAVIASAVPAL